MLGLLFSLGVTVATIWAAVWALTTLAELKQGQQKILRRLAALEVGREHPSRFTLPNEALLPPAPDQ